MTATTPAISPLRQRMIDDMRLRKLADKTQSHYLRAVRQFSLFLGHSPDRATIEDLRRYQLHLVDQGISAIPLNAAIIGLKFFFDVTLDHPQLMRKMQLVRIPRTLPVVLSREEVARLIEAAGTIKYQTALSLAYGTGLRATQMLTGIDWNNAGPGTRELIESITGATNRQGMVTGLRGGGAVICVVQSSQDDSLFDAIQKTAKRAATKQLTGNRPGLILLEFGGMSPEGMVSLAEHDNIPGNAPTGLRRWASEFLSNCTDRDHIVGIGFLSRGTMRRPSSNVVTSSGSAYVFPRRDISQWNDAFSGLFNQETESAEQGADSLGLSLQET